MTRRCARIVIAAAAMFALAAMPGLEDRHWITGATAMAEDVVPPVKESAKPYDQAKRLMELRKVWKEMVAGGLGEDEAEARSQLQNNLDKWAEDSGVNVTQRSPVTFGEPGKDSPEAKFHLLGFHLTATGSLSDLARLLWRMANATVPIRITELGVFPNGGKEGRDDLQFQLAVSTISRVPGLKPDNDPAKADEAEIAMIEYAQNWHATPRYLDCLRDLTVAFPPDGKVYVTSLTLHDNMKGEFVGKSTESSDKRILQLMDRLRHDTHFQDVILANVRKQQIGQIAGNGHEFIFTMTFKYVPAAAMPTTNPAEALPLHQTLLTRSILARDGRSAVVISEPATRPALQRARWNYGLAGITIEEGQPIAHFEKSSGEIVHVRAGDPISQGRIIAIDIQKRSVDYKVGEKTVRIGVGDSLEGSAPTIEGTNRWIKRHHRDTDDDDETHKWIKKHHED